MFLGSYLHPSRFNNLFGLQINSYQSNLAKCKHANYSFLLLRYIFLECDIQQGNNNSDSPILALHWKRYLFGFLLFYERKMTDYSLHSCHGLFFYFVLKRVSVQCNKEKKEFTFIKFRRILKAFKAPRIRCLRMSKNPTNEVGP